MKRYFFDDLGRKFPLGTLERMERDIQHLEGNLHIKREIVKIANIRKEAIDYWNKMDIQDRKDFGKTQDEKENGDKAKGRSLVSFESVGHLEFEKMSDFWKAIYLSSVVKSFEDLKK